MDRLHRHGVDLRLRLPQPLKHRARPLVHRLRQPALPDHRTDLGQMPAVHVTILGRMIVRAILVLVLVRRPHPVRVDMLMPARVVVRVHEALTRRIDMHIVVPNDWTVVQAHDCADALEESLEAALAPAQAVIHVDPFDPTKVSHKTS